MESVRRAETEATRESGAGNVMLLSTIERRM
jgi:hypothetical protein